MFGSISYLLLKARGIARNPVPKVGNKALLLDDDGDLALKDSAGNTAKVGGLPEGGLGDAATKDVGTGADDVAAGNHDHDAAYSPVGHDHDSDYAAIGHTHAGFKTYAQTLEDLTLARPWGSGAATLLWGSDNTVSINDLTLELIRFDMGDPVPCLVATAPTDADEYSLVVLNPWNVQELTLLDGGMGTTGRIIDFSHFPNLAEIEIAATNVEVVRGLSRIPGLDVLRAYSNLNLLELDLDGCTITDLDAGQCSNMTSFTPCEGLVSCVVPSSGCTGVDLSNCSDLEQLDLSDSSSLAYVIIPQDSPLQTVDISSCVLTESTVDQILTRLAGGSVDGGTVDLSGGSNSVPSAAGLAAKATLEAPARGWTVTVNS